MKPTDQKNWQVRSRLITRQMQADRDKTDDTMTKINDGDK